MDRSTKEIYIAAIGLALVFVLAWNSHARAEDASSLASAPASAESFSSKLERLQNLKQTDPEAFRKWVSEHKQGLRERMENLKQTNPQKYQEIVSRKAELRDRWAAQMKQKNPAQYERWMTNRREQFNQRLENFKQNNPQGYERLMQKRAERQNMRAQRPAAARQAWREQQQRQGQTPPPRQRFQNENARRQLVEQRKASRSEWQEARAERRSQRGDR